MGDDDVKVKVAVTRCPPGAARGSEPEVAFVRLSRRSRLALRRAFGPLGSTARLAVDLSKYGLEHEVRLRDFLRHGMGRTGSPAVCPGCGLRVPGPDGLCEQCEKEVAEMRLGDIVPDTAAMIGRPCWRKRRHESEADAEEHLRHLLQTSQTTDVLTIESYECRHCGGWHVGHDRRKERPMTDVREALEHGGGVVVVLLGKGYDLPEDLKSNPRVRGVDANALTPSAVRDALAGNARAAILTDRIDHKIYLALHTELRRRKGMTFVLRKTPDAVVTTLRAMLPNGAAQAEPAEEPRRAPHGAVTALVEEFWGTVAAAPSVAEGARQLLETAQARGLPTTLASVEQSIRTAKRKREERAAAATAEASAHAAAQHVPVTVNDRPGTPELAAAAPERRPDLTVLQIVDDAIAAFQILRDFVAGAETEVASLRERNAQLERERGELQAKLDLLRDAFGKLA